MATYRERREARAEKLRGWSASNAAKADGAHASVEQITSMIPFGQPILVGHHSEKRHRRDIARIDSGMRASVELNRKAGEQASRADEIDRQAANAIYSDDPDAVERLTAKIAAMEGERERMKSANADFRKANREALKGKTAYERSCAVPFPSYSITNLGGSISRAKARLAQLQREQTHGPRDRLITARFDSTCETCDAPLKRGEMIRYNRQQGARCASGCSTQEG